jgi:hypothetical protein
VAELVVVVIVSVTSGSVYVCDAVAVLRISRAKPSGCTQAGELLVPAYNLNVPARGPGADDCAGSVIIPAPAVPDIVNAVAVVAPPSSTVIVVIIVAILILLS